jgi:hypothetical protein
MVQEEPQVQKLKEILMNVSERPITYEEAKFLCQLPIENLEIIQKTAFNIRLQHFGRVYLKYAMNWRERGPLDAY